MKPRPTPLGASPDSDGRTHPECSWTSRAVKHVWARQRSRAPCSAKSLATGGTSIETDEEPVPEKEAAIRAVAQLADHVHWVRAWPENPTWHDQLRRWTHPEFYRFDRTATPPKPWVDRPAGAHERTGWRIRAGYVRSKLAFEVEYVVCDLCGIGWVESPLSYEGYKRCGLASAALRSLRRAHPGLEWHTGGGHFRESVPFWDAVGIDVPGGYSQQDRCLHVEPWQA